MQFHISQIHQFSSFTSKNVFDETYIKMRLQYILLVHLRPDFLGSQGQAETNKVISHNITDAAMFTVLQEINMFSMFQGLCNANFI